MACTLRSPSCTKNLWRANPNYTVILIFCFWGWNSKIKYLEYWVAYPVKYFFRIYIRDEFHEIIMTKIFSFISPPNSRSSRIIHSVWKLPKSLVTSHLIRKRTTLQNQEKVYGFSQAFEKFFLKLPRGKPLSRDITRNHWTL